MKAFVQHRLSQKAKKFLDLHRPLVIAVTGSVGKTSVRNAIATVLAAKFRVRTPMKNYNNEFGVPLTILGCESPGKSVWGWLRVLFSKPQDVPEVYVLEYAIDRPGDMKYLCEIARPKISVLTRITPVHAAFFRSIEHLAEEKAVLVECTAPDGLVLLNADDPRVLGLSGHARAPIVTYGFSTNANVRASDYELETREDFSFEPNEIFSTVHARVTAQDGDMFDIELKNMLGISAISALLPAIAIAKHLGLTREQILSKIPHVVLEPGRMNAIAGIKGSLIIDSSYNAAPASMDAALDVLAEFHPVENARRVAVLGHMAELGRYSEEEHRRVGRKAGQVGVDLLVSVGEIARDIRRGALEAGVQEDRTRHFQTPEEAGRWLDAQVKKGDIVLVKGSQSARMEKVVKDIMAEPLRAGELLVRQTPEWLNQ